MKKAFNRSLKNLLKYRNFKTKLLTNIGPEIFKDKVHKERLSPHYFIRKRSFDPQKKG